MALEWSCSCLGARDWDSALHLAAERLGLNLLVVGDLRNKVLQVLSFCLCLRSGTAVYANSVSLAAIFDVSIPHTETWK